MSVLPTRSGGRHRLPATSTPALARPARSGRRPGYGQRSRAAAAGLVALAATTSFGAVAGPAAADDTDARSADSGGSGGSAETPAARAARAEPLAPGTPCSASARACVDLDAQRAWLVEDGEVVRGPMRIASGGDGRETPVGHSLRVYRQDADHVSGESTTRDGRPAPMPWSTFFADGGIAFHAGDPDRSSAGCIRMQAADAEAVFDELRRGDKVQVVHGAEERAARAGR